MGTDVRTLGVPGIIGAMADPRAELSSVTTSLDELTRRLAGIADATSADETDSLAIELYEVERALQGAHRRLVRLLDNGRS